MAFIVESSDRNEAPGSHRICGGKPGVSLKFSNDWRGGGCGSSSGRGGCSGAAVVMADAIYHFELVDVGR